jgi:hypothetical protein
MSETFSSGFVRIDIRFVKHHAPRIGAPAVTVYLVLAAHADAKTRQCFPSLRTISRLSKLSRPTVLKAIGILEEERLIKVERGYRARGDREVNRYTLLPIGGGQPASPPVVNDVDHRGQAALSEQDPVNKTEENKRVGAWPERSPSPRRTGDANLDHPAVKAYRDAFKLTPNELQRAEIAAVVTDVATWQEVLRNWQLASYKKNNIPGMLDKFRKELCGRSGGDARSGRAGSQGNRVYDRRESRTPETPEEAARRDAEWAAFRQSRERHERDGQ